MTDIFLKIASMSITGSYVILFVLVARIFLKRLPKVFSYSLWSVVFFRLICPVTFKSMFSFLRPVNGSIITNVMTTPVDTSGVITKPSYNINSESSIPNLISTPPPANSIDPLQIVLLVISTIWLIGISVMLIYSIISYIKLRRRVAFATRVEDNIYECDLIDSPFVLGIVRPKIYLPLRLLESEKSYIIDHEKTHIKRLDYIIKPLAYLALCIHWFNPLVWLSFKLMVRDMEMSCDEKVISKIGDNVKKEYSYSLLNFATSRKMICGSPLAFGENTSKSRIINILKYKKPSFWIIIVAIILVAVLGIGLLSNPNDSIDDISIEVISQALEPREDVLVAHDSGGTLVSGEKILEILSMDKWSVNNEMNSSQFKIDRFVFLDNKEQTAIGLDAKQNSAVILHDGITKYYDVPKDTYDNLILKCGLCSFYIPGAVTKVVTSGEMTNIQSINETPVNVDDYITFRIGDIYHSIYAKNGKYYCESPYQYVKKISKEVYEDSLEYLDRMEFSGKFDTEPNEVNKDKQADVKKHEVVPVKWSEDTSIGVDMATLDYASNNIVIFHGYFGLFVYDLDKLELIRSLDLGAIGCDATQGDDYCQVEVSSDGNIVQLHPMSSDNMFLYKVNDNTLLEMPYKDMEDKFTDFKITSEVINTGTSVAFSYKAVEFNKNIFGYLHATDWNLGSLNYVKYDMVYSLFVSKDKSTTELVSKDNLSKTVKYVNADCGFELTFPDYLDKKILIHNHDNELWTICFLGESQVGKEISEAGVEQGVTMFFILSEDGKQQSNFLDGVEKIGTIQGKKYYYATPTDYTMGIFEDLLIEIKNGKYNEISDEEVELVRKDNKMIMKMKDDINDVLKTFKEVK